MFTVPAALFVAHSALAALVWKISPMPDPRPHGGALVDAGKFQVGVSVEVTEAQAAPVPPTNFRVVAVDVVDPCTLIAHTRTFVEPDSATI